MAELSVVGQIVIRLDALDKVTGKAKYSIDKKLPGMLHARILRSPHPHARIVRIDTSLAEKAPGVKVVVTGNDLPVPAGKEAPTERFGFIRDRWMLARDKVRFVGEPVAAVAAETPEEAEEALSLIKVEYAELPAIFDPEEAMKPNPPVVVHPDFHSYVAVNIPGWLKEPDLPNVLFHRRIKKGDLEKGFKEADVILENRFSSARISHAALERFNSLVEPHSDGGFTFWETTHMAHRHRADLARVFGVSPSKVRFMASYMGGCFGNGTDIVVPTGIAAMLARKADRPVKLTLSREEVFTDGSTREPIIVYIKDGVKKDGTLVAREIKLIVQAGAYSGLMVQVARSCPFGAVGTYRSPNFKIDSYAVATNEPPCAPFRGFGAAQLEWAIESHTDMLAAELGMDPLELRLRNLLNEGEEDSTGQITHSIGVRQCLEKAAEWLQWNKPAMADRGPWKRGKGIAAGNKNTLAGTSSVVLVKVHPDATIELRHSVHEVGQGGMTAMAQIAAEEFKTKVDSIKTAQLDTDFTPYEYGTVSSRSTFHTGNAVRLACQDARRKIFELASTKLGVAPELMDVRDGKVYVKGAEERVIRIGDLFTPFGFIHQGGELLGYGVYTCPVTTEDLQTGQGKRVMAYFSHGATAAEVAVNEETGEVKVLRMGSCFDGGQPINPKMCEQQIESGAAMGIGMALLEEVLVRNGRVATPSFMDYKIPTSMDIPLRKDLGTMM
ncbi:MAG: xanthine dehydrogenase family protein molybdopterin-binding subunit, partial [Dehalococcoidia bacterium]|nr:xanthine dehydrogenase family protein molybdopterin-binding subunit [Dehalococcoidia bacterium]